MSAAPQQHAQAALSDEQIDEVIAAMGWDLDPVERNDVVQFARAILAASQPPAAAPRGHSESAKMLETNQLDELGEEISRLQKALCFWLPSVTDREDEVALRILDDAFLLVGIDGNLPDDFKTAQELGWVNLPGIHADDIAWGKFAEAGRAKMAEKRTEGRSGWDDPAQCLVQDLATLLVELVGRGDPVNIANVCMMIWNRIQSGYPLGSFDIITAFINRDSVCEPIAITDQHAQNGIKWYVPPARHLRNGVNLYVGKVPAAAPAIQQEGAALDHFEPDHGQITSNEFTASGVELDAIGDLLNVHRDVLEPDTAYRTRLTAELMKGARRN